MVNIKMWFLPKHFLQLAILVPALAAASLTINALLDSQPLAEKIIVVDAGHGGIDPGGNRQGILEKDINLAISLNIRDNLKKNHAAKVVLTRDSDSDLSGQCDNGRVHGRYRRDLNARIELIQESDADLFVSIHANTSSRPRTRGFECYYAAKSAAGKALALAIQSHLKKISPQSREAKPADFFVLRNAKIPAVLIEIGYITNPDERELLTTGEYQQKIAAAIVSGIIEYYQTSQLRLAEAEQ